MIKEDDFLPKKSERMIEEIGILAPNGDFYPCYSMGHEELAASLSIIFYDTYLNATDMEQKGWYRFDNQGRMNYTGYRTNFTQAQIDTLFDFACEVENRETKSRITRLIKENNS